MKVVIIALSLLVSLSVAGSSESSTPSSNAGGGSNNSFGSVLRVASSGTTTNKGVKKGNKHNVTSTFGSLQRFTAYPVTPPGQTSAPLGLGGMIAQFVDRISSFIVSTAIAQTSLFQQWVSLDSSGYDPAVITLGNDEYVLYTGYPWGVKKISSDGTLTTILSDQFSPGPGTMVVNNDGIYLPLWQSTSSCGNTCFALTKLDLSTYQALWEVQIPKHPERGDNFISGMTTDTNGNVYVSLSATFGPGELWKIAPNGTVLWTHFITANPADPNSPPVSSLPGFLAFNGTEVFLFGGRYGNYGQGSYLAKFTPDGVQTGFKDLTLYAAPGTGDDLGFRAPVQALSGGNLVAITSYAPGGQVAIFPSDFTKDPQFFNNVSVYPPGEQTGKRVVASSHNTFYFSESYMNTNNTCPITISVKEVASNGSVIQATDIGSFVSPDNVNTVIGHRINQLDNGLLSVLVKMYNATSCLGSTPSATTYYAVLQLSST